MVTVLFACVRNAGRSQMAAAFFNALADRTMAEAVSAGTTPDDRVDPIVVQAMREVDLDVGANRPQQLTEERARRANLLITMGCGDECPYIPGVERDDWQVRDPAGLPLSAVREIRDDIQRRVANLVIARGW